LRNSEIYLLFTTLLIGLMIILLALFQFVKPSKVQLSLDESNQTIIQKDEKSDKNSWVYKISKKNQDFTYPTQIYKLDL